MNVLGDEEDAGAEGRSINGHFLIYFPERSKKRRKNKSLYKNKNLRNKINPYSLLKVIRQLIMKIVLFKTFPNYKRSKTKTPNC